MDVVAILPEFLPVERIKEAALSVLPDLQIFTDTSFDQVRADVLIVTTFTKVDDNLLSKFQGLKFIQVASTGYDNVDIDALRAKGIMLSNIPVANKESVAEHVLSMVLSFLKDQRFLDREIREGRWPLLTRSFDLMGKTFGIVGFGAIGKKLAERLIPFEVGIVYTDIRRLSEDEEELYGVTFLPLDELVKVSDIISVHVPLTENTKGMFNSDIFQKMKDGCIFINTSRGEVVVESDLVLAIKKKGIRAGIDVFSSEPVDPESELLSLENTILSPHIAGVTLESQERFIKETMSNVLRYTQGIEPLYRVI